MEKSDGERPPSEYDEFNGSSDEEVLLMNLLENCEKEQDKKDHILKKLIDWDNYTIKYNAEAKEENYALIMKAMRNNSMKMRTHLMKKF